MQCLHQHEFNSYKLMSNGSKEETKVGLSPSQKEEKLTQRQTKWKNAKKTSREKRSVLRPRSWKWPRTIEM
jgi:hypothetical protein